jgi:hypothetical protein
MTDQPRQPADSPSDHVWEQGWEGHERAQKERMARLTLAEKLAWLEEAQRVARHLQQSAARGTDKKS